MFFEFGFPTFAKLNGFSCFSLDENNLFSIKNIEHPFTQPNIRKLHLSVNTGSNSWMEKPYHETNNYLMTILILFFGYVVVYLFASQFGWLENNLTRYLSFGVAAALGLWVCIELMRSLRNNQSSVCAQIPLGPALVTSAFIFMIMIPAIYGVAI